MIDGGRRRFHLLDFLTGRSDGSSRVPAAHRASERQDGFPLPSSDFRAPVGSGAGAADFDEPGPGTSVFGDTVDSGRFPDVAADHGGGDASSVDPVHGRADPRGDAAVVDPVYDADDRNWVRYRPGWGGFPRVMLFVLVVAVSVFWVRDRIYGWIDDQVDPVGAPGVPVEFTVVSGWSVNDVADGLQSAGVISNATVFRYWLRCDGELALTRFLQCDSVTSVVAGDYVFREGMGFEEALAVLSAGPEPAEPVVYAKITIPEGLRWTEMADRLIEGNPDFDRAELDAAFVAVAGEADYLPEDPRVRTAEGLLFPATYDITHGGLTDEHGFLRRLSDEFDNRFARLLDDPGMSGELLELGLEPYDVIVVASLIEEEALVPGDRPKIARVIYNRLAVGERLGIDATACYAANKSCADLTHEDIDSESPWNTRVVRGLPPTPISAPGEASIRAALQPAAGDWMFYVLTDADGVAGAHHFSVTIEEHITHVEKCRELGYCG